MRLGNINGEPPIAVRRLLERGDEVTALARDSAAITVKHDRLRVAKGEARDAGSIARAAEGQDAVLSAFGPRAALKKDDLQEVFMRNLVAAMEKAGVKRLSNLSAWGAGDSYSALWIPGCHRRPRRAPLSAGLPVPRDPPAGA